MWQKVSLPRYIIVKMSKVQDKNRILKSASEKSKILFQGTSINLIDFWQRYHKLGGKGIMYFKFQKKISGNQDYYTQQDLHE